MRHPYRTVLLAISATVLLTSCSWSQTFRLTVTVVDQKDGTSIFWSEVAVDASDVSENQQKGEPVPWADVAVNGAAEVPPVNVEQKPALARLKWRKTDVAGRAECDFSIHGYTTAHSGGERWNLSARKEGYESVLIDFKPDPPPEGGRGVIPLSLRVEMRRAVHPPR